MNGLNKSVVAILKSEIAWGLKRPKIKTKSAKTKKNEIEEDPAKKYAGEKPIADFWRIFDFIKPK